MPRQPQVKDRALVAQRMKAHVAGHDQTPLLIFPEGTCVNNEYCVMFKVRCLQVQELQLAYLQEFYTVRHPCSACVSLSAASLGACRSSLSSPNAETRRCVG